MARPNIELLNVEELTFYKTKCMKRLLSTSGQSQKGSATLMNEIKRCEARIATLAKETTNVREMRETTEDGRDNAGNYPANA